MLRFRNTTSARTSTRAPAVRGGLRTPRLHSLLALCTLAALAAPAVAQGSAPQAGATPSPAEVKARREFQWLDMNGDQQLSRSEVRLFPRLARAFDEADTDGNGLVSFEEVQAFAARYRAERDRQRAAAAATAPPTPGGADTPPAPDSRP